jgi:hypothetical protein
MSKTLDEEEQRFRQLLAELRFADRYYAYCAAHLKSGPDIPLATQTAVLGETGRTFRYYKGEKFFAWRDANAPKGCELGLNVAIGGHQVEWIFVFRTPAGAVADTFAADARKVKQLTEPTYRHDPPYPVPRAASKAELAKVIDEGLALYDDVAAAIAKQTWK